MRLTDRVFIIPSFGIGIYSQEDGVDLGLPLEFRSGLEIVLRLHNGQRLVLVFGHVSNCGLGRTNPDFEMLGLLYGIPLTWTRKANN